MPTLPTDQTRPTIESLQQRQQELLAARLRHAGTPLGLQLAADLRLLEQELAGFSIPQKESPTVATVELPRM